VVDILDAPSAQETQANYSSNGLLSMWSRPALVHAATVSPAAQPLLPSGSANGPAADAGRPALQTASGKV
jgi:hypothetical protein